MAKYPHQFKLNKNNEKLINKENILENYVPVIQLGIQGPPGLKFTIGGGGEIEVGTTGIYEINLSQGLGQIRDLRFMNGVEILGDSQYILVDIIYNGTGY